MPSITQGPSPAYLENLFVVFPYIYLFVIFTLPTLYFEYTYLVIKVISVTVNEFY